MGEPTLAPHEWPSDAIRAAVELVRRASPSAPPVVVDVGAHHGETMAHLVNSVPNEFSYFGFEPNPESFEKLTRAAMSLPNRVLATLLPVAAGPVSGSVDFQVTQASAVSGVLTPETELMTRVPTGDHKVERKIEVDQVSIDDLCSKYELKEITILKIDAEGYDLEVLKGALQSLSGGVVDLVVCEVFFVKYREGQAFFWDIATFLTGLGFSFVDFFDSRKTHQNRLYTANSIWASPKLSAELGYF